MLWTGTESGNYTQSGNNITLTFGNIRGAKVGYWVGIRLTSGEAKTVQGDVVPAEVVEVTESSIKVRSPKELNASGCSGWGIIIQEWKALFKCCCGILVRAYY